MPLSKKVHGDGAGLSSLNPIFAQKIGVFFLKEAKNRDLLSPKFISITSSINATALSGAESDFLMTANCPLMTRPHWNAAGLLGEGLGVVWHKPLAFGTPAAVLRTRVLPIRI